MRAYSSARLGVVVVATMLAGCQAIEMIGPSSAVSRSLPAHASPRQMVDATLPRVYLMRGLAQTVSEGVDHLSAKLRARGYAASVHAYGDWPQIANAILADQRRSGGTSRAVVVGHSLGANSVVALVNALAERNTEIDLAVTFDPTVDLQVVGGVRRFINFYQSDNGWGRMVRTSAAMAERVENSDLRAMVHLTHFNIDRDAQVHDQVIAAIAAIPPAGQRPAPVTRQGR